MALSQANVVKTKYIVEVTPGTTPAAALTILPVKTSNITASKTTVTSQEIRSDRATADLILAIGSSAGDIGYELSFTDYTDFFESALGGTKSTLVALVATDISAASGDNSYNSLAAAFSTANILPGMWIKVKGFATAANNGIAKVVSVTTAKIIVSHKTLVTEAAGPSVTVNSQSIRNGAVKKTFTLEKQYPDLTTTFSNHKGMLVNTATLNCSSGAIVEGTFGFMGRDSNWATATVGTGADITPAATPIMSATANCGTVFVDGTALATTYAKSINLSLNNNARALDAISNAYAVDVNLGSLSATVAVQLYFNGSTEVAKFLAGTAVALSWSFFDSVGNYIVVDVPYGKYNTATVSSATLNADTMQDLSLTALLSPTLGYMVQISILPA
jgi:hypothetical protein